MNGITISAGGSSWHPEDIGNGQPCPHLGRLSACSTPAPFVAPGRLPGVYEACCFFDILRMYSARLGKALVNSLMISGYFSQMPS